MEIQVLIKQILPELSGVTKENKSWHKQQFVGEPIGAQYPKPIKFDVFNPSADFPIIRAGQTVTFSFDVDSRPYTDKNGTERWNTSVNVWKAVINSDSTSAPVQQASSPAATTQQQMDAQANAFFSSPQDTGEFPF